MIHEAVKPKELALIETRLEHRVHVRVELVLVLGAAVVGVRDRPQAQRGELVGNVHVAVWEVMEGRIQHMQT